MKIEFGKDLNLYNKKNPDATKHRSKLDDTEKLDTVQFAHSKNNMLNKSFFALKSSLLSDIAKNSSRKNIAEITQKIQQNEYYIPTENLANSMI